MEEFALPTPAGEETDKNQANKRKKLRTPGFLETYLKLSRQGVEKDSDDSEKTDSVWKKLARLFRKSDSILPKPELIIDEPAEVKPYELFDEPADSKLDNHSAHNAEIADEYEIPTVGEQKPTETIGEDSGELIIDHNDVADVPIVEVAGANQDLAESLPDELKAEQYDRTDPPESVGSIVKRMSSSRETVESPERTQEYIKKQRQQRMQRDVRQLKYRGRQQINRQKALEQRQQQMEEQLQSALGRKDEALKRGIDKQPRPFVAGRPEASMRQQSRTTEIETSQSLPLAPELDSARFENRIDHKPDAAKAKEVLHQVEIAAKENMPIEQLYERRHEIKDESNKRFGASRTAASGSVGHLNKSAARMAKNLESTRVILRDLAMVAKSGKVSGDSPELYKQSIKAGFWAAISFLILAVVTSLVK